MIRPVDVIIGCLLFASVPVVSFAQQSQNDTSTGRDFSVEFCAACHVVTSTQRAPTIYHGATPSFAQIANKPTSTAASLRQFVRTTHATITRPLDMPELEVTDYQLDEIIRYILSLRRKH